MQRSRCIAHPAGIETHIDDRLLHFRQAPAVAIVEQETPLGTASVLTEITLGAAGRFAAFDDLVTLAVRAADGDERHGPFLPMRSYEDEAQCDSYLSPSPLLKHYPRRDRRAGPARGHGPLSADVRPRALAPSRAAARHPPAHRLRRARRDGSRL